MSDNMSIDHKDPSKENTPADSKASTPDHEQSPSTGAPEAQPAKRKGGRKPVSHPQTLVNALYIFFFFFSFFFLGVFIWSH
jgi:hypothetical protein